MVSVADRASVTEEHWQINLGCQSQISSWALGHIYVLSFYFNFNFETNFISSIDETHFLSKSSKDYFHFNLLECSHSSKYNLVK